MDWKDCIVESGSPVTCSVKHSAVPAAAQESAALKRLVLAGPLQHAVSFQKYMLCHNILSGVLTFCFIGFGT